MVKSLPQFSLAAWSTPYDLNCGFLNLIFSFKCPGALLFCMEKPHSVALLVLDSLRCWSWTGLFRTSVIFLGPASMKSKSRYKHAP